MKVVNLLTEVGRLAPPAQISTGEREGYWSVNPEYGAHAPLSVEEIEAELTGWDANGSPV